MDSRGMMKEAVSYLVLSFLFEQNAKEKNGR